MALDQIVKNRNTTKPHYITKQLILEEYNENYRSQVIGFLVLLQSVLKLKNGIYSFKDKFWPYDLNMTSIDFRNCWHMKHD